MKKLICFLTVLIGGLVSVVAREPYGDYISRYIVTMENGRPTYHAIYDPIKNGSHYSGNIRTKWER